MKSVLRRNIKEKPIILVSIMVLSLLSLFIGLSANLKSNSTLQVKSAFKKGEKVINKKVKLVIEKVEDTYIKADVILECEKNEFESIHISSADIVLIKTKDSLSIELPTKIREEILIELDKDCKYLPNQKAYKYSDLILPITSENYLFPFGSFHQNISLSLIDKNDFYVPNKIEVVNASRWYLLNSVKNVIGVKFLDANAEQYVGSSYQDVYKAYYYVAFKHPMVFRLLVLFPLIILFMVLLVISTKLLKNVISTNEVLGMVLTIIFGIFGIRTFYSDVSHEPNLTDIILAIFFIWSLFIAFMTFTRQTSHHIESKTKNDM
jgi:hypothetical protein